MSERIFTIYKITNAVTGKAYVGVTFKTVQARFKQHWDHANRANSKKFFLQSALVKYGRDAFTVEAIAEAYSEREAVTLERAMIASHNTMAPNGYNLSTGGEGSAGWTASPEMRKRMGDSRRGLKWSAEKRAKMAAVQSSDEYRAKMRINSAKRGPVVITDEMKARMSATSKKQFADPAARKSAADKTRATYERDPTIKQKISATLTGRKLDPERYAALVKKCATPEHRAIMKEVARTRKKRDWTPEQRAQRSVNSKEISNSPDARARKSATMKAKCAIESEERKETRRQTMRRSLETAHHRKWSREQYETALNTRSPLWRSRHEVRA